MREKALAAMTILLLGASMACISDARAEVVQKVGTFGGMRVSYFVVLPDAFEPDREYPAVLAFAGGSQSLDGTRRALENHWVAEAERRGYIVVSPAAPMGRLFFQTGAFIFPSFLDWILRDYNVEGGRFHVAGRSNGGLSAFHVAASHPEYFRSITGFPGYLQEARTERVDTLTGLCIYMHVGEFDPGWARGMAQQARMFRDQGIPTQFTVEEGMGHGLDTLAGTGSGRLFEHFEEATETCG